MGGTLTGGRKAAAKNLAKDPDFYRKMGQKGGRARVPKGFATLDRFDLSEVSRKGGNAPKRKRQVS